MRLIRSLGALAALALCAGAAGAQDVPPLEYEQFTLENGLTFIVHEDHSVPVVAVDAWYDVGSAHEVEGRTGFAHLFEHMLSAETEHLEWGQIREIVSAAGGSRNASTTTDRTNYFEILPSNRVNLALWLHAERMARLVVDDANFAREREVVKEERRMRVENQPYGRAMTDTLPALAIDWAPYEHAVIGSMEDLDASTAEDVREFYRTWYVPNNATIVVAGDVTVGQVRALAEEYFADIPRGPEPPALPPVTPTPRTDGERRTVVEDVLANQPLYAAAYAIPPHAHPDSRPLSLLGRILGSGESSRLNQRIVKEERAAVVAQAGVNSRLGPGYLQVIAVPNQGVELARIEALVDEVIAGLAANVTERELQKAKNQTVSSMIMGRQTVMAKAEDLHHYRYLHGDVAEVNRDIELFRAVTLEDLKRVAATYLVPENRAVVHVVPAKPAS